MYRSRTAVWLAAAVFCGVAVAQDEWSEASYPNPQLNALACRPKVASGVPSFLCDPDGLLDPSDASELDKALNGIREETQCPCSASRCTMERLRNQTTRGYTVTVALLKKRMTPDESIGGGVLRARKFALGLRTPTNYGGRNFQRCEEDVIVLFSIVDRALYIATGPSARVRLPDAKVSDIIDASRARFAYGVYEGIRDVVYALWAALS